MLVITMVATRHTAKAVTSRPTYERTQAKDLFTVLGLNAGRNSLDLMNLRVITAHILVKKDTFVRYVAKGLCEVTI